MKISPIPMDKLSNALYTLNNNDMLNASFVDVFAMDTPRTVVEFNHRGKQAGIEMAFREYTGTLIAEFSAAAFALVASFGANKLINPKVNVNSSMWATDKSLDFFNSVYKNSDKTEKGFVTSALNSMTGLSGKNRRNFKEISEDKKQPIIDSFVELIKNKNLSKDETKKLETKIQDGIITALGADSSITFSNGEKEFSSNLSHSIRDIKDLAKNVFFKNEGESTDVIIDKLKKINKSRIGFAIPLAMFLGITNQYINRQLTKKRTGIDNFVGENGYEDNVKEKNEGKKEKGLLLKKIASAGLFCAMLTKVMGVKKPSDFISKLEFDGPATSGNAIKTVYGTLILGRIFASKDSTELRETNVRDYLGFLNWLVLGGFVSKGVAKAMDKNEDTLFNVAKEGKGVKHFLDDISLKTHKEIIAQGGDVKGNLKKLNIASLAGIGYSAVMLGVLLPKLNIWMTKSKAPKNDNKTQNNFQTENPFIGRKSNLPPAYKIPDMKDFIKQVS